MVKMNHKFFYFAGLLLTFSLLQQQTVHGANILGLFTTSSPSHLIVHMAVVKALAEKGHNVTVVTALEPKSTHPNIHAIVIPATAEQEKKRSDLMSSNVATKQTAFNYFLQVFQTISLMVDMQMDIMRDERFTRLYDCPDTRFDLLILGQYINDFELGVAAKFKCPIIVDYSLPSNELVNVYVGNPLEMAYVPMFEISVKRGEVMNYWQRVGNFFAAIFFKITAVIFDYTAEQRYYELFPRTEFPSYWEMKQNISLVFCNGHFSEGTVRPNVPALIDIGGIQVKEKPDPLPHDIGTFLNSSSEQGAILLSMGTNIATSHLNDNTVTALFKVLSGLKQNVIWKWEDLENTPGQSSNILYKKWLPQDDILAHPNLKLFITHAGKGSVIEAQYHGVPMVAIPSMFDQPANANQIVTTGYGVSINLAELTENVFRDAVHEVLNNPIYDKNVKEFSQLFRDRPMTPKETVIYWSEYVIRYKGAPHMQSPMVRMSNIEVLNLDVVAFLVGILYATWRILKYVFVFSINALLIRKKVKKE